MTEPSRAFQEFHARRGRLVFDGVTRSKFLPFDFENDADGDLWDNSLKGETGWTVGGGVEWMFAPHWSAFLEGNYMDFGSNNTNGTIFTPVVCPAGCTFGTKATAATALVGVNYRFW